MKTPRDLIERLSLAVHGESPQVVAMAMATFLGVLVRKYGLNHGEVVARIADAMRASPAETE